MASFIKSFTKTLSKPKKVTPNINPYGAPEGLKGLTGVKNGRPFQDTINQFGTGARKGLRGLNTVRRGS